MTFRNYEVRFYYNTDLRHVEKVDTTNEVSALSVALHNLSHQTCVASWVQGECWRVEIVCIPSKF